MFPPSTVCCPHIMHSEASLVEVLLLGFLMIFIYFQTLMPLQTEDGGSQLENPMDIPKELWMMVDYLYQNAAQQVGGG